MSGFGNQHVPLALENIEDGAFLRAIERALIHAQHELVAHVEAWGERAGKAKAEVNIAIKFQCESTADGVFSIEPVLRLKLPARPPRVTAAMAGPAGRESEQRILLVRHNGCDADGDDPRQHHLPFANSQVNESADGAGSEA